ncbi:MAG TPA: FtsX-like permease family protein [Candidatus Bathyarchaeia archaeon]|nr:FtsX-like permease family protein [Candidatus Bathyarchaeia archaeon]
MIGPLGFATRNLKRRGFHSLLALFGLALTVASMTLLLLLGRDLISRFNLESYFQLTFGIDLLIFGYLLLSLAAILIVGIVSTTYLASSMINQRMKDVAVLKAAGSLPRRLYSYIMAEGMTVILSGCITGTVLAIGLYWWVGSSFLPQFSITSLASGQTVLIVGGTFIGSLTLSYLAIAYRINSIVELGTSSGLSSQMSTLDLRSLGRPLRAKRLGSAFNLAARSGSRDRQFTKTLVRISICIFLAMIVLTGVFVADATTRSYVERALPPHVLIMATGQVYQNYADLARSFSSNVPVSSIPYLNQSNMINPQLTNVTRQIPGVVEVDTRLITMTLATGTVIPLPFTSAQTGNLIVGSGQVMLVGIDPDHVLGQWYASNGFLSRNDRRMAVVGDTLVGTILSTPLDQVQVRTAGAYFDIKGSIVDPLNRGRVVYVPVTVLQELLGIDSYNLVLVKIRDQPGTLQAVQQLASQNGLILASQDPILNDNLSFLDNTWSSLLVLPVLALILTSGILLSYLTTSFSKRFNDYVVIKIVGAKASYLLKLLFWEGWGIVAISMAIGISSAILFSIFLLVPEAETPLDKIGLSVITAVAVLSLPGIASSLIYSRRLRNVTVKDLRI